MATTDRCSADAQQFGKSILGCWVVGTDRGGRAFVGLSLLLLMLSGVGCGQAKKTPEEAESRPDKQIAARQSVTLRVAVVNDPGLARAVERLRGEWVTRSGTQLEVLSMQGEKLRFTESLDVDVIVFPSWLLAELGVRDLLAPVRSGVLRGETLLASDIVPVLFERLGTFGGKKLAVPLGVDPLMVAVTGDGTSVEGGDWGQFDERTSALRAKRSVEVETEDWTGRRDQGVREAREPVVRISPIAAEIIVRFAARLDQSEVDPGWFDPQTLVPFPDDRPFLRAVAEVAARYRDPSEGERAGVEGRSTRETAGESVATILATSCMAGWGADEAETTDWVRLPRPDTIYRRGVGRWIEATPRDPNLVLLGPSSRVVGVTRETKEGATAFRFLSWLASREISTQLAASGNLQFPVRYSLLRRPESWFADFPWSDQASEICQIIDRELAHGRVVMLPKIVRLPSYLRSLELSGEAARRGQAPTEMLDELRKAWGELTKEVGEELLREAYLGGLE